MPEVFNIWDSVGAKGEITPLVAIGTQGQDLWAETPVTNAKPGRSSIPGAKPLPPRGFFAETASALGQGVAEGLTTELPKMVGGAIEFAGSKLPDSLSIVKDIGQGLKEWSEAKSEAWFGPEQERKGAAKWVYEGSKMLAPSVVPGALIGTGLRVLRGVGLLVKAGKAAELAATVATSAEEATTLSAKATELFATATKIAKQTNEIASGSTAGLFGLSQAQQTVDTANQRATELEAQGKPEEARQMRESGQGWAPLATGTIEAAGEYLGTKYLGKLFRLDEAAVAARGAKNLVTDFLKTLGVEVGTEMGQQAGEAQVEKSAGIRPEANPLSEALDVIGPVAFMTLLTGGAASAVNRRGRPRQELAAKIKGALEAAPGEPGASTLSLAPGAALQSTPAMETTTDNDPLTSGTAQVKDIAQAQPLPAAETEAPVLRKKPGVLGVFGMKERTAPDQGSAGTDHLAAAASSVKDIALQKQAAETGTSFESLVSELTPENQIRLEERQQTELAQRQAAEEQVAAQEQAQTAQLQPGETQAATPAEAGAVQAQTPDPFAEVRSNILALEQHIDKNAAKKGTPIYQQWVAALAQLQAKLPENIQQTQAETAPVQAGMSNTAPTDARVIEAQGIADQIPVRTDMPTLADTNQGTDNTAVINTGEAATPGAGPQKEALPASEKLAVDLATKEDKALLPIVEPGASQQAEAVTPAARPLREVVGEFVDQRSAEHDAEITRLKAGKRFPEAATVSKKASAIVKMDRLRTFTDEAIAGPDGLAKLPKWLQKEFAAYRQEAEPQATPPTTKINTGDIVSDGLIKGKVLGEAVVGKKNAGYRIEILTGREKGKESFISKEFAKLESGAATKAFKDADAAEKAGTKPEEKVIPTTKTAEVNVTTPKEQKAYVKNKVEGLIKDARERHRDQLGTGEIADADLDKAVIKGRYSNEIPPDGAATIIIDVPNDGQYKIPNTLKSLLTFQKNLRLMTESSKVVPGSYSKESNKPTAKKTSEQIAKESEGEVEVYNERRAGLKRDYQNYPAWIKKTEAEATRWRDIEGDVNEGKRTLKSLANEFGGKVPSGRDLSDKVRAAQFNITKQENGFEKLKQEIAKGWPGLDKELKDETLTKETDRGVAMYSREGAAEKNVVATLTGKEISGPDYFQAAKDYYKQNLQGKTLHRDEIGDIRVTGKGWEKARRGITTDALKAKLFPAIRDVIEQGEYHGREVVTGRRDDIVAFHYFDGFVDVGGDVVQVGATVAEDSRGNLFYNINHDADQLWSKRKAHHELGLEAPGGEPLSEGQPSIKYNVAEKNDAVNLIILSTEPGMSTTEVTAITDKATSGLKTPPKIHVAESERGFPVAVLDDMDRRGILDENMQSDVKGFTWDGEIWVNARLHTTTEGVVYTLAHELTHDGLGKFLRNQDNSRKIRSVRLKYNSLMDAVYEAHKQEVVKIAQTTHTHLDTSTLAGKRQAAEEWLAYQSYESQPKWYDRMVAIFHDVMRAIGLDVKFSDAEVRVVLQDAFKQFGERSVDNAGQVQYARGTQAETAPIAGTGTKETIGRKAERAWAKAVLKPLERTAARGVQAALGRTSPAFQAEAERFLVQLKEFWDPGASLPDKDKWLAARAKGMGDGAQAMRFIEKLHQKLDLLSDTDDVTMFQALDGQVPVETLPETFIAEHKVKGQIVREELKPQEMARMIRSRSDIVGQILLDCGIITKEQFNALKGHYVHYAYAYHVLGDNASIAVNPQTGRLDLSETLHRNPDLTDQQRKELGLIDRASIAVPLGMGKALMDIAKWNYMKTVADNPDWVWQPSLVKVPLGKQQKDGSRGNVPMTMGKLIEETKTYAKMAQDHPSPEVQQHYEILKNALDQVTAESKKMPADFKQLPTSKSYGPLAGAFVRNTIADDLLPVLGMIDKNTGAAWAKVLEVEAKAMAAFKMGKVALNPPTMFRNVISNFLQMNLSGRALPDLVKDAVIAAKAMKADDANYKYHEEAFRMGLFNTSWTATEVNAVLDEFRKAEGGRLDKVLIALKYVANFYGKIDDFFKYTMFVQQRLEGKSVDEAAVHALKWAMDYSLADRSVKVARRHFIPFLTYQYKIAPLISESLRERPWVIGKYMILLPLLLKAWAKGENDLDDEDMKDLEKQLPEYIKKSGSMMLMPYKTDNGKWQWLNAEYFMPWGNWYNVFRDMKERDIGELTKDIGISHPILDTINMFRSARDGSPSTHPFFGTQIYNELDSPAMKVAKMAEHLIFTFAPSAFSPSQGAAGYTWKAATGDEDRWGRKVTPAQAVGRWFGFNVVTVSPDQTAAIAGAKIQELKASQSRIEADPSISEERKQEYRDRLQERLAQAAEASPTAILPILKAKGEDPVYDALRQMVREGTLKSTPPGRSLEIAGIPFKMTETQYKEYLEKSSDIARTRLKSLVEAPGWATMSRERKSETVSGIVTNARKGIRQKIKAEMARDNREKILEIQKKQRAPGTGIALSAE